VSILIQKLVERRLENRTRKGHPSEKKRELRRGNSKTLLGKKQHGTYC
jgi:hypothetical protein